MKKKFFTLLMASLFISSSVFVGQAFDKNFNSVQMYPNARNHVKRYYAQQVAYKPWQIKTAYGINKLSATGKNQKIAVIVAYGSPTLNNDLKAFNSQLGLPTANLQTFYPQGKTTATDEGWAQETSLDVEWSHALAPSATIDLVVAKSSSSQDLLGAVDYASKLGAQVVSMSWGTSEFAAEASLDVHFQHEGTVYVSASGDNGAGTSWPSVSPNVLAVGGTNLPLNSQGNLTGSESAWSGSGGGISKYEKLPAYQHNLGVSIYGKRAVPDVAFDADPNTGVLVNYNSSWYVFGGTSLSSPAWAAFIALIDEGRKASLTNVQIPLYSVANSSSYNSNFRDITAGSSSNSYMYSAKKGYDLVTGLGTPLENNLFYYLSK